MLNKIGKVMMYFLLYETLRDFASAHVLEGGIADNSEENAERSSYNHLVYVPSLPFCMIW